MSYKVRFVWFISSHFWEIVNMARHELVVVKNNVRFARYKLAVVRKKWELRLYIMQLWINNSVASLYHGIISSPSHTAIQLLYYFTVSFGYCRGIIYLFWDTYCYSCQSDVGSQGESKGIVLFKEKTGLISHKAELAS